MPTTNRCPTKKAQGTDPQQRTPGNDTPEPLKALPPALNELVREPISERLPWERGDAHACGLVPEDIAECFKVGVAPAHEGVS